MATRHFAATVTYDGSEFAGSQIQAQARTVQGELETATVRLFGARVRVALAGRTDSGVHARGQVMAVSVETRLTAEEIERALNAILPIDVAIRLVREVAEGFDPRRHATSRWYRYTVARGATRDPLIRRTSWQVGGPLDLNAMRTASGILLGVRDFRACSGPLEVGRTSVRSVSRAEWSSDGCSLWFDIEANAFLPGMVRRIVGALVRVGRRGLAADEFRRLVESAAPGSVGPVAPPQGLCLERVVYDEGYGR